MMGHVDGLLRFQGPYAEGRGSVPWVSLAAMTAAGGFLYGAVMGSYGLRPLQGLYSAIKVPMFLGVTTVICLPSYYVVNALLGLRADFAAAFRGILAAQATLAICLAALAPITVVFYLSITHYPLAPLFNGLQFAIATAFAQMTLGRHYRPLVATSRRHLLGKYTWVIVYVFVAIQMAWVLRPFIGAPNLETQFFRADAWTNAYVYVMRALWRVMTRG